MVVFMIVGRSDPVYEIDLGSNKDDLAYLHQFILHSSLDLIENAMWINSATFLRVVDRFNNLMVSAYVTPGGAYLLLLHDGRSEDSIRGFFIEAHDIYVKYMMNPFATFDSPIYSQQFDSHIRGISRRLLSL
eukprot:gene7638-15631_t